MKRLLPLVALLALLVVGHARIALAVAGVGPMMPAAAAVAAPAALPTSGLVLNVKGTVGITSSTTFTWADQSAAGLGNLTATGANRPATGGNINGFNAVVFNGSVGNGLNSSSNITSYTGASTHLWTYMAVFQSTFYSGLSAITYHNYAPTLFGGVNGGAAEWLGIGTNVNATDATKLDVYAAQYDTVERAAIVSTALKANPHYMLGWWDGTNLNVSVDGGAAVAAAASAYPSYTDATYMGKGLGSTYEAWGGSVLQLAAWNRVLSSGERTTVGTHVTTTWGAMGP